MDSCPQNALHANEGLSVASESLGIIGRQWRIWSGLQGNVSHAGKVGRTERERALNKGLII